MQSCVAFADMLRQVIYMREPTSHASGTGSLSLCAGRDIRRVHFARADIFLTRSVRDRLTMLGEGDMVFVNNLVSV